MTVRETDAQHEVERERLQRVEELEADRGPSWREEFRPGSFGCHELLDRTSLLMNSVDEWLLSHPACVADGEWFALAQRAFDALNELYRRVGEAHLEEGGDSVTAESQQA